MLETAVLVLQWGLGLVFAWTGVLIFKDVPGWATMLEKSWVRGFLPSPTLAMKGVAVFDIVVGVWLITGIMPWVPALLAALHLLSVLLVTGIFAPSYRDVGLMAMAVALVLLSAPFA